MSLIKKTDRLPFLFDDLFTTDWLGGTTNNESKIGGNTPAVNVKESESAFKVEVAVPGYEKDDFEISVDNGRLVINSEKSNFEKYFELNEFDNSSSVAVYDLNNFTRILPETDGSLLKFKVPASTEDYKFQLQRKVIINSTFKI